MNLNIRKITYIVLGAILTIIAISYSGKMAEEVGADEICVIQHPLSGVLDVYTTPGTYNQYLGTATHYKKRSQFWFSKRSDQGEEIDQSIKIRFNDGGHAQMSGSVSINMPTDEKSIIALHTMFGSQASIEGQLVATVVQKAVYMTGPLMSSKESNSEKRNDLLSYVEDQASHGVYKTTQKDVKTIDPLSGQEKIITVVEIVKHPNGSFMRQEATSPLDQYNIHLSNLSINSLDYDAAVETQIKNQQALIMQVQSAMANAKKAEQDAITTEQQGKADAATAKWEQEVIKTKNVTAAQAAKEVAALEVQTAGLNKQRDILVGEAEAAVKRLAIQADNALQTRIDAWVAVNAEYAKALSSSNWVPTTVIGGGANGGGSGYAPNALIDMMMIKTAKDLNYNPKP